MIYSVLQVLLLLVIVSTLSSSTHNVLLNEGEDEVKIVSSHVNETPFKAR